MHIIKMHISDCVSWLNMFKKEAKLYCHGEKVVIFKVACV